MLQIHRINLPDDKHKYIDAFDPKNQTWLVADLMSKRIYQERFLRKNPLLEGYSVLRAREFWENLYKLSSLKYKCISSTLARLKIQEKLKDLGLEQPGTAGLILNYIDQFLPIISHPQGLEQIEEWLKSHSSARERWSKWFQLSSQFFNQLKSENTIVSSWIPVLLLHEVNVESLWERPLVVDVGPYLNEVEAELFEQMSRFIDVQLLMPHPSWKEEYQGEVLQSYSLLIQDELSKEPVKKNLLESEDTLEEFSKGENKNFSKDNLQSEGLVEGEKKSLVFAKNEHTPSFDRDKVGLLEDAQNKDEAFDECYKNPVFYQSKRFKSALSEVKFAISKVRSWLEAGISPDNIAIMAPDVGYYWPILKIYSDVEGLFLKRRRASAFLSFPQINHWLSQLEIRIRKYDFSYLEIASFYNEKNMNDKYLHFKKKYLNLYDRKDVNLSDTKNSLIKENKKIKFKEFLEWSLSFSEKLPPELLEKHLQKIMEDVSEKDQFYPVEWLSYLRDSLSSVEIEVSGEQIEGVQICDISSGESIGASHIILMGLSENALRKSRKTSVLRSDIEMIRDQTGLLVPLSDILDLEFQTQWIVGSEKIKEVVFNFSETDFEGKVLDPSYLWQKISLKNTSEQQNTATVLGSEQNLFDNLMYCKCSYQDFIDENKDLKQRIEHSSYCKVDETFDYSLSASSLEDFVKCPFIFSAKKVYGLRSEPEWDIDLDFMNRGNLIHKLFPKLLEKLKEELSDEDILELIEESREAIKFPLKSQSIWDYQKKRYLSIAKNFIAFERAWREEYKELITEKDEVCVEGYIDSETGEFLKSQREGAVPFKGRIDRVDKNDKGECVVIDYKFSKSGDHRQSGSWIENDEVQLMLYAMALEAGLIKKDKENNTDPHFVKHSVLGAIYFFVNPLKRDTGFLMKGHSGDLFPDVKYKEEFYKLLKENMGWIDVSVKGKGEYIDNKKLVDLYSEFKIYLVDVIHRINERDFTPKPKDDKDCKKCDWKGICRASHLN